MRKSAKTAEAFKQFYSSTDGKKMMALADMFLDQLRHQIETGIVGDFNRNYRYQNDHYEFLFNFTCDYDSSVQFIVRHRKNRYDLMSIQYCPEGPNFLEDECWVQLVNGNDSQFFNVLNSPYFSGLLDRIVAVSDSRTLDLIIPVELVEQIERKKMDYPEDHLVYAKDVLNQNRKMFSKSAFSSLAHTLRFIDETLPFMESAYVTLDGLAEVNALSDWLASDIPMRLNEHALLQEEVRFQKEDRLLDEFHHYYLKALDIRSRQ